MLTVHQILSNLTKGQSGIRARAIINDLEQFYILVRPNLKLTFAKEEVGGTIIYTQVPSEKNNLTYDVVLWVNTLVKITMETNIRVYSNSPFFAFNLAYVYYKQSSLLFPQYYPSGFRTVPPKVRNPLEATGFDKHVYASLKYVAKMDMRGLIDLHKNKQSPSVRTFEQKQQQIETLKKKDMLRKQ